MFYHRKKWQELPVHQRADAVNSLVYEANARARDPVYGCVGAISYLQNQVAQLQMQLAVAQAEILCIQVQQDPMIMPPSPPQAQGIAATMIECCQDEKSVFLLDSNLPAQYLDFTSSSNVTHESLQREPFFGHDIVS